MLLMSSELFVMILHYVLLLSNAVITTCLLVLALPEMQVSGYLVRAS